MELTGAEKTLMEIVWKNGQVFMKDILESYPEPKPAATTVATLLKRLQDKNFVGYETFGNSRRYHPLVKKTNYFSKHVKGMIKNYFDNSPIAFASFFTTSTNLSAEELKKLRDMIDQQLDKKKK